MVSLFCFCNRVGVLLSAVTGASGFQEQSQKVFLIPRWGECKVHSCANSERLQLTQLIHLHLGLPPPCPTLGEKGVSSSSCDQYRMNRQGIHMCLCVFVCLNLCMSIYARVPVHGCPSVYVCVCLRMSVYTYRSMCLFVSLYGFVLCCTM